MSAFEFVYGFVTIISSLALTHLATSFVRLVQRSRLIRFSLVQACFMWGAFATTVVNWAGFWPLRSILHWPAWMVILVIAVALAQYVFCALVAPEHDNDYVDLSTWDNANRSRYVLAALALVLLAMLQNIGLRDYDPTWLSSTVGCLIYGALVLLTCVPNRWIRSGAAVAFAAWTTWSLYLASDIAPAVLAR